MGRELLTADLKAQCALRLEDRHVEGANTGSTNSRASGIKHLEHVVIGLRSRSMVFRLFSFTRGEVKLVVVGFFSPLSS